MRPLAILAFFCALSAAGCGSGHSAGQTPTGGNSAPPNSDPVRGGAASTPSGEEVDNPQYKTWANLPKGTVAVQRTITETEGNDAKTVTTVTYTLLEITPEYVKLRSQATTRRYDGYEAKNPPDINQVPHRLVLPKGIKKEDFGKPVNVTEQGEETITVGGKEYKTRWGQGKDRDEAGEVFVRTWRSDGVPGGLVKSVARTPAIKKVSTIELIEVKAP
jgi:hypothetical protein